MCCGWLCKWHGNPLNMTLHLFAFIILLVGVWGHDWSVIGAAVVVAIIGHLSQLLTKKKAPAMPVKPVKKGRR